MVRLERMDIRTREIIYQRISNRSQTSIPNTIHINQPVGQNMEVKTRTSSTSH